MSHKKKAKPMDESQVGDNEHGELRAKLVAAIEKAKDVCDRLQEQTVAAAKASDKAVREHPYQAVGAAFGLGLLVGLLISRTRRDED
jgi:ElaB/YqjD/DUF883 family membrane-anchored ribosome-binding protein